MAHPFQNRGDHLIRIERGTERLTGAVEQRQLAVAAPQHLLRPFEFGDIGENGEFAGETVAVKERTSADDDGYTLAFSGQQCGLVKTRGTLRPFSGQTYLFVRPPYRFRAVDALMTNFHLPRTTLLVLVRTFGGDELIRRAYDEAIREEYRFYSYGDAMLIL